MNYTEPNDSFYRSIDRDPDRCMLCCTALHRDNRNKYKCRCMRCEASEFKTLPEYLDSFNKHFDNCLCRLCIENLSNFKIKRMDIGENLISQEMPRRAILFFEKNLSNYDFFLVKQLSFLNTGCLGWDGISKTCQCGSQRMIWTWNKMTEILKPTCKY